MLRVVPSLTPDQIIAMDALWSVSLIGSWMGGKRQTQNAARPSHRIRGDGRMEVAVDSMDKLRTFLKGGVVPGM